MFVDNFYGSKIHVWVCIYVTKHRDAEWIGRFNQATIYPTCTNSHQKIAVLTTPIYWVWGM